MDCQEKDEFVLKRIVHDLWRRTAAVLASAVILLSTGLHHTEGARRGSVQFSDGETITGGISLTPGMKLKIHDGTRLRVLSFDLVREIRFMPGKEKMEHKWRFTEPGRTQKEKIGEPYPVRYIRAVIDMAGNQTVRGHLYTTALYVEGEKETRKVILSVKQRGQEGETFADIVYPVRIAFEDETGVMPGRISVRIQFAGKEPDRRTEDMARDERTMDGNETEVRALAYGALARLEAVRKEKSNEFMFPFSSGAKMFIAVKVGDTISVGWPESEDEKTISRVTAALKDARDFFDGRKLLGVYRDNSSGDIYSLLMLSRKGKTTLDGALTRPWRLGIWRWKEENSNRIMLAKRGYFFRGLISPRAKPPKVNLSSKMWDLELKNGTVLEVND